MIILVNEKTRKPIDTFPSVEGAIRVAVLLCRQRGINSMIYSRNGRLEKPRRVATIHRPWRGPIRITRYHGDLSTSQKVTGDAIRDLEAKVLLLGAGRRPWWKRALRIG